MERTPSKKDKTGSALPHGNRLNPSSLDVTEKPEKKRKARHRPEPSSELRGTEAALEKRAYSRPIPPGVMLEPAGYDEEYWTSPHSDRELWTLQLADAFGTRSQAVFITFMRQLEGLCDKSMWDEEVQQWHLDEHEYSAALAMVSTVKPKNEMEAALAAQMVAVHMMQMKLSARAIRYEADTQTAAVAGKLARTFNDQLRVLQEIQGKKRTTRQSIKVSKETHHHQHVHVHRGARQTADNPMNGPKLLTNAPLCQARTRAGTSCRCPAIRGRKRCRLHGGRSTGAPKGKANGNWKHGGETNEAVALRKQARKLLMELRQDDAV